MTTVVLYARIDAEVKAALDRIADESGASLAAVTNRILRRGLGLPNTSALDRVIGAYLRSAKAGRDVE